FGGNPLGCAVAMAALDVLESEKLAERSAELGAYFMGKLNELKAKTKKIKQVRGKGLLIGVVMDKDILSAAGEKARKYTTALKENGVLAKETHDWIIRFAPPLVITKEEIDWAMGVISKVLA
ncbi:MAG TPA: aminotransferase class III-fold pyridoxal phosphate-dependent enzyme, partial [bacterium]|nr:aminotransferase class III-fold pyridoxal phosphate-dependent enzyme [bacterium]